MKRTLAAVLVGIALLQAGSAPAQAARDQIGYCVLEAPPGHGRSLYALAARARDILPRIEADLGARPAARYRIFLIPPGAARDSNLARLEAAAPPWAAGFMLPRMRVGAIRIAEASRYPYGTIESVLAHEATHMLLHDAAGGKLPLWFEEGVATWIGRRWSLQDAFMVTRAILMEDLPSLSELDGAFRASAAEAERAYAASFAFVSWSARRHGSSLVRDLLDEVERLPFADAWSAVTGETLARSEAAWRRESLIRYRWVPILTASSTLWAGISVLALVAGIRRRRRAREARERWGEEEGEAPAAEGGGPGREADAAAERPPL